MEAVRKPKSKTRSRVEQPAVVVNFIAPTRPKEKERVQGGRGAALDKLMPEMAEVELGTECEQSTSPLLDERERSHSPEPEEIVIEHEEQESDQPARRYIFPRTSEVAVEAHPSAFEDLSNKTSKAQSVDLVYPTLEPASDEAASTGVMPTAPAVELSSIYPQMMETGVLGLLSDQELLAFYHNAMYETSEDLVDKFCKEEANPNGPLYELLLRLKTAVDGFELAKADGSSNASSLDQCLPQVWSMQPRIHNHTGVCGEYKRGSGVGKYEIAVMNEKKMEEMSELLRANRDVTIRKLMGRMETRSLVLQIQWIVINLTTSFHTETGTTPASSPALLDATPVSTFHSRTLLRAALSDLFAFLRLPNVHMQCTTVAHNWITELTCALHKSCLPTDGLWMLCHVLRLPSVSADWTAPLIQTFVQSSAPDKLKMDYCLAMLSLLMSPVISRETFLSNFKFLNKGAGATWMNADEDDENQCNLEVVSESDLTALLEQLPIADFYSIAIQHFTTKNLDRPAQFMSLIAFQLLLMKIFAKGMDTYSRRGYKAFCKQIGMALRKSVRELASHWKARQQLAAEAECQLQKEVDRVILLAVNYVIASRSLGLWQYLVDFPYDAISEDCRLRVEYLLRKSGDEDSKTVRQLFEMNMVQIAREMQTNTLADRLETAGAQDTIFLVKTLAALVAASSRDPTNFLREMVEVCLVDESTRDSLYKVGREAIATLLEAKPSSLDALITILDRNIDHIEEHVVDIFANSPLHFCKISESVVGGVIGKWLISRAPDTPGNRVARRLLSALNWGYDEKGEELWLGEQVHAICAETLLKAHVAHCARSSGLYANTVGLLVKYAYSMPDHDANFSQFCWQLLVKLKLPIQESLTKPETDLAAYFLHAAQYSMSSAEEFAESGLYCIGELLTAGCAPAAVVLLTRAFSLHYERAIVITGHANFLPTIERLLHADQSSYAYQLVTGSTTPTLIGRLIACAITYESRHVTDPSLFLRVWVDALVVRRATVFNTDEVSLQLLGTIVRLAFELDPTYFGGIINQLQTAHKQIVAAWEEASQGYLNMIYAATTPPPLIPSSHLSVSPWASFACLCVEESAFDGFHTAVYDELAEEVTTTVEEAVKKAGEKLPFSLPIERLPVFRWMELCMLCGSNEKEKKKDDKNAPILALALQRIAQQTFGPKWSQTKKYQLARQLCAASPARWKDFDAFLCNQKERKAKDLVTAVASWIRGALEISKPSFSDYARFDLGHLLQMVIDENKTPWTEFVDLNAIAAQSAKDVEVYASICHGKGRALPSTGSNSIVYARAPMRKHGSRALPFPLPPDHSSLTKPLALESSMIAHPPLATAMMQPLLNLLSKLVNDFNSSCDLTKKQDADYCDMLRRLHTPTTFKMDIVVTCGELCTMPTVSTVKVKGTHFNRIEETLYMNKNRQERDPISFDTNVASHKGTLLDGAALQIASIEHVARELCSFAAGSTEDWRSAQASGRALYDLITSFVNSSALSLTRCPPVIDALEHAHKVLGKTFITLSHEGQLSVIDQVLLGSPLSASLAESFVPDCLTPFQFVEAYRRLTDVALKPELTKRAFLLLNRFSLNSATSISALQLRPLIPLVLINVAAVTTSMDLVVNPLGKLFIRHFLDLVFHSYPVNFAHGLELILKGDYIDGCNRDTTSPVLLKEMLKRVKQIDIDAQTAVECIATISQALSPGEEGLRLGRWSRYRDVMRAMVQLFITQSAGAMVNTDAYPRLTGIDLTEAMARLSSVFGPLS